MFQKEVALRISASPNTGREKEALNDYDGSYGRLSIICQYLCTAQRLFDLSPSCFTPPPKVFSSVVHMIPKTLSTQDLALLPTIESITLAAFNMRRKMVRTSLKPLFVKEGGDNFGEEYFIKCLERAGVLPTQRPETITIQQYKELANILISR